MERVTIMYQHKNREYRLGKYQFPKPVRIIRGVLAIWFGVMLLVGLTTVLTIQKTANIYASSSYNFVPIINHK